MLQRDQDRDDLFLVFRLVYISRILIVYGKGLLAHQCDQLTPHVSDGEIELQQVPLQAPTEAFEVRDVFYQMKEFVG